MNKAKINDLYEQAHLVYEIPYEASVVDPGIIAIYKQKVWDRYLFAQLIVAECMEQVHYTREDMINENISQVIKDRIEKHFGVEQ